MSRTLNCAVAPTPFPHRTIEQIREEEAAEINAQIADLDSLSRRRALTDAESVRLQRLIGRASAAEGASSAPTRPRHRVASIRAVVCNHFGITPAEIVSKARARHIAHPRQVAMHLARRMTLQSWKQIAGQFGREDHTTALHAHKAVTRRRAADPAFNARVRAIVADVQRIGGRTW